MNSQIVKILSIILIVCSVLTSKSEDIKKLKYGKVTKEELQMKSYEQDTSADAVVLYQYAEFIPLQFKFLQLFRYKVLKKTGTSIASRVFYGKLKNSIKGCTYNLENGEIVKTKLTKESIFEEQVIGDIYRTRVAMPNVKEGSVFEIEIFQEGIPESYEIQQRIPVIYGAIYFPQNPNIDIRIKEIGYLGYTFKGDDKWIVKDMPSFKNEPFITSDNDYRVRMELEILSYSFIGVNYASSGFFASSWDAVTQRFMEHEYFGKKINGIGLYLNSLADSIKLMSKNEEELAKNAFESIKRIKWNEQEACYLSQELKKTFELKQGNSADINLNLVALLKKLALKSYPVLFSTRENGIISKYFPTIDKFNYVVAAVELPTGTKYLDATDEFVPFDLPTERILNCLGHALEKGKGDCSVFIKPEKKLKKSTYSQLSIDSTGRITGKISIKRSDYTSANFKHYLKSKPDHDTYIQELEAENSGWYIDSYKFNNLNDSYQDFVDEYQVNYSNSLGSNEVLLVNPFVIIKPTANPFQSDKRYLPINFPQQTEYSSIITINIPSNYQVSELPKSADLTNNDKSIRFTYKIQSSGSSISISTKFYINKLKYETIEYMGLRGVFELMLQKQNESIVLKKI
ncbi:MAG: hypothetical protein EHM93_01420 [Bacteroidales bacterium]|nr:MAG: hypothetical protein EHM93_01420 [Bacteroidales bacterium]